jgi:hypothetical protein
MMWSMESTRRRRGRGRRNVRRGKTGKSSFRRPSNELEDDDAAVGLVFFFVAVAARQRRRVAVERQLEVGLVLFASFALLLLALPNLLDDERR